MERDNIPNTMTVYYMFYDIDYPENIWGGIRVCHSLSALAGGGTI